MAAEMKGHNEGGTFKRSLWVQGRM